MVDLAPLEDLRGRLRWMSSIVASTDDAIIGQDLDGIVTSWNVGAQNLYGYTAEEAIGRHVSFLVPNNREAEVSDYLNHIQSGGSVRTLETVRLRRDGKQVYVSLTISAVRDALDQMIGISKIARDVTERVEVEAKLRDQAKQRDMFLAMLSHELRNPLSAVLTASRYLSDDRAAPGNRARATATIQRQSAMMACLLDDLLDVSRVSLGKIELSLSTFNLVELIESIHETTLPEITSHQAQLRFEILDNELYVRADWARLIQVHVNLIHNAAKYSPPGSPIFVTMRAESGFAMVTVRDEGSGIQDKVIVESLVDAGFEMSTLTAFIWAPVVFVAWADGNLDALEKAAILDALPNKGLSREMASMMIEHAWFTNRPKEELWRVWEEFANATLSSVPSHEREAGMDEIVDDSSAERLWP